MTWLGRHMARCSHPKTDNVGNFIENGECRGFSICQVSASVHDKCECYWNLLRDRNNPLPKFACENQLSRLVYATLTCAFACCFFLVLSFVSSPCCLLMIVHRKLTVLFSLLFMTSLIFHDVVYHLTLLTISSTKVTSLCEWRQKSYDLDYRNDFVRSVVSLKSWLLRHDLEPPKKTKI